MINLETPIRTANQLQWNVQSLPHSGEYVQVAYTLSLDGQSVEQGIKTLDGVIVDGVVSINTITNTLINSLNN
jgi:hypothetical protein